MRKRSIVTAASALVVLGSVLSVTPAQAGPGFAIETSDGGRFAGHAEAGGQIIWHGPNSFSVKIGVLVDKCPADRAGAYLFVRARQGEFETDHILVARDAGGCNTGGIADTVGPFNLVGGGRVAAAQVRLNECDATPQGLDCSSNSLDHASSTWKWNPNP